MSDLRNSQFQLRPDVAAAPVCATSPGVTLPAVPTPTLTASRGTRPLSARRPAGGSLHEVRRRSA